MRREPKRDLRRVALYTALRLFGLLVTVLVGVYLTIYIANMGAILLHIWSSVEELPFMAAKSEAFVTKPASARQSLKGQIILDT